MIIKSQIEKALERTGGDIPQRLPDDLIYPRNVYALPVKPKLSVCQWVIGLWLATGLCIATGLWVLHLGGWRSVLGNVSWPLPITLVREVYHTNEIRRASPLNTWDGPTNSMTIEGTFWTNNNSPISNYWIANTIITNYIVTNGLFSNR